MTLYKNLRTLIISSFGALSLALFCTSASAFDFEAGDTNASLYGYVKLDMIYDFDNDLGDTVDRGAPRLDGDSGPDGYFRMLARESRFGFNTSTPVAGSTLKTTIEGDFFSSGNNFRLRQAYGEWNNVLAGQTWTNFSTFISSTPLIAFTGPTGRPAVERQTQLRYTMDKFSFSLEDPAAEGGVVASPGAKSELPDLILRYTNTSGAFKYSVSGVARYLGFDTTGTSTPAESDNTTGWGVGADFSMDLTDAFTLRAGLTHGDGIGGYVHGNPKKAPAFVTAGGDLETIETTGGTLGASLKAGPGAINVAYSKTSTNLDDAPAFATDDDTYEAAWVNYIWSPRATSQITYGVEANWNKRETVDGREGDASRLQASVIYDF